jgi:cell division protein FtsN
MLFGLSLGLVVAAAVYVSGRNGGSPPIEQHTAAVNPASPETQAVERVATDAVAVEPHPVTRFDFYEMLPKFEVVIPEVENNARPDRRATAVAEPGNYVLQAGSFREVADADRMQATLALLGIESRIQRVAIDDDLYHRVRIGPTGDLAELNTIRRRLWDAQIEALLIKVPN